MIFPNIATRADLDALAGSPEHDAFLDILRGSINRPVDVAVYPEGYGTPGYHGPAVEPVWREVEDLTMIERFGFSREEVIASAG